MWAAVYDILLFPLLISKVHATSCMVPPTFWCDDPSLARECGVATQCDAYERRVDGKNVSITLLYEALCGGCRDLILNHLYPEIWLRLKHIVNLELVPFGNAVVNGTKIVCQHGPTECSLNKLESCALNFLPSTHQMPFIFCLEKQLNAGVDPKNARQRCFSRLQIQPFLQRKIM